MVFFFNFCLVYIATFPEYVEFYGVRYTLSECDQISLLFRVFIKTKQLKKLSKVC